MVLENLFRERWVERRPVYSLLLGMIFSALSLGTSLLLFNRVTGLIGISAILFTVILALQGVNRLLDIEEKREARKYSTFFKEHEEMFDFFIYFFLGVFLVFFITAMFAPQWVFSTTNLDPSASQATVEVRRIPFEQGGSGVPPPPPPSFDVTDETNTSIFNPEVLSIFTNNLYVMLVAFLLSLFYSSGAMFLITFNASIFASALASVVRAKIELGSVIFSASFAACNLGIMIIHMVPEVGAYGLAAIAGGVLSKAILKEKFLSPRFRLVMYDSLKLLGLAVLGLLAAALLEVHVSKGLFSSGICAGNSIIIYMVIAMLLTLFILFEFYRKAHRRRRQAVKTRK